MYRLVLLIFCATLVVSCRDKKPAYPYLNKTLNEPAQITGAECKVLYFQKYLTHPAYPKGITTTGNYWLYCSYCEINLSGSGVWMNLHLKLEHSAAQWKASASREERIRDCEAFCETALLNLAKELQCDRSLIHATWSCIDGDVSGELKKP